MEPKGWVKIVERLGISTMYALVAIYGLYCVISWVAPRADEFLNKHFETMDKLTTTAEKIEETQKVGIAILEKFIDDGRTQNVITEEHKKITSEMNSTLKEVHKDIKRVIVK